VNVVLAALTTLLIAIFAAAFAAPYVVDWNEYRTVFEAQASKVAGRPVRVEGDVDLTILPVPEIRFERIRIADRSGSFETPSATARAFRVALSIPPLLRGKVEARKVELDRLSLRLTLDERGQLDWPRAGETRLALPFLPSDVSLKSVQINGASVEVARLGQPALWRIEGVSGKLSAETLRGPFKFNGRIAIGDEERALNFSLGSVSEDGQMPVKAISRGGEVVYRAEGNITDGHAGPVFAGDVSARAPQPENAPAAVQRKWQASASVLATMEGADLKELELMLTRDRRPQTLTGKGRLSWTRGVHLDAELAASWLDLDLLTGEALQDRRPVEVLLGAPSLLGNISLPARTARIEMKVRQISLGGDLIRDLGLVAQLSNDGWGVEKLDAGLPGGSVLSFKGRFSQESSATSLQGRVRTSGRNLGRLLQWAAPELVDAGPAEAKSFFFTGEVESSAQLFGIRDVTAKLGKSRFTGSAQLSFGEQPSAEIAVDARTLDLRPYLAETGTEGFLRRFWADDATQGQALAWQGREWRFALHADRLLLPELQASDVDATVNVTSEAIEIQNIALRGRDGLFLEGEGQYPRAGAPAEPELRMTLKAKRAEALQQLAGIVPGVSRWLEPNRIRLQEAMPLRVTASMRSSTAEGGRWLRLDGTAAQTDFLATMRVFGERYHVSVSAQNPRLAKLAGQLAPGLTDWLAAQREPRNLRLDAEFAGEEGAPWEGQAVLKNEQMRLAFDGLVDTGNQTRWLDGEISFETHGSQRLLAIFGLPEAEQLGGDPALSMTALVSGLDQRYRASEVEISFAGERVTGEAQIDTSGVKPVVQGAFTASRIHLAPTAKLLLATPPAAAPERSAYWSDAPFVWDTLNRFSGKLSVKAETLMISQPLSLDEGEFTAELRDDVLHVSTLNGGFYGGMAVASATLRRARGRTVFDGDLEITGLDLEKLPHGNGDPLAIGQAELRLSARSEGLTPRGLVTVISGRGTARLGKGEIRGLDPRALVSVAKRYIKADTQEDGVATLLAVALRDSRFEHAGAEASLLLEDGALRFRETRLRGLDDGFRVGMRARLDLDDMILNNRWDLGAQFAGEQLPDIRVTFAGPLSEFGKISPQIAGDAYQQFLTVQVFERNMERLQRLRRERDQREKRREDREPITGLSSTPQERAAEADEGDAVADPRAERPRQADESLPNFSTAIEETSEEPSRDSDAVEPLPSSATSTPPSATLDDPSVVEDARRELLREAPAPPSPGPSDRLFEIFEE